MIAAAFVLMGSTLIVVLRSRGFFGREGIRPRLIAAVGLWFVAGVGSWLALRQPGFDLDRTGLFTFGWQQLGFGLLFGLLGLMSFPAYIVLAKRLGGQPPKTDTLEVISSASLLNRLFFLITAAGAEELIFRAVAIGALMAAGINHSLAIAIPLIVFVLLHRSSWGILHLLFVMMVGSLLTAAFILGGLWAAILAHFIVDAPLMLAGKAVSARANRNSIEAIGRD